MSFLFDLLKGVVIGIANIIPGVSGGTLAVTMGIYDKMINAVNTLFKKFIKSLKVLLPIGIGMAIGIVLLSFIIEYCLGNYPLPTNCAFIGLIVGGLPVIAKKVKGEKPGILGIILFLAFFALIVGMQLISGGGSEGGSIEIGLVEVIKLFGIGVIASATMIVPGVSGSMVLMILGYYQPIIETINTTIVALKDLNFSGVLDGCAILVPFGIGVVVGIFAIAKIIAYLFANFEKLTYYAILGLIGASPVAILMNTDMSGIGLVSVIVSVVCFAGGYVIAMLLGENEDKESADEEQ